MLGTRLGFMHIIVYRAHDNIPTLVVCRLAGTQEALHDRGHSRLSGREKLPFYGVTVKTGTCVPPGSVIF